MVSGFGRLIPVLVVIVGFFALYQLWTAIVYLVQREYIGGSLYLVFSFAGLALARALWMNRAKFSRG